MFMPENILWSMKGNEVNWECREVWERLGEEMLRQVEFAFRQTKRRCLRLKTKE